MEVWRHQRYNCSSAKVYYSDFHVRAMNKYVDRGDGNEELGECKRREGPTGRVVGLWPAEFPRFLFTVLIEALSDRVPLGKKLHKTGRVDTEV